MERELWRWVVRALKRLPRRWRPGQLYSNREILAVLLWAALHERAVSWACRRDAWPMQAWRRRLPDQATMSRRLRRPDLLEDLQRLLALLRETLPAPRRGPLLVDGKPLVVSWMSGDKDARRGWAAGGYARGYKLHALIDAAGRLLSWCVHGLNHAESVAARELLDQAASSGALPRRGTILGDAAYDSNPLHAHTAGLGLRLVAPRRKPGRGVSAGHRQHPGRLASIRLTERTRGWRRRAAKQRARIERFFGSMAGPGGLWGLPPWVRRPHRVRVWVAAKMALHTAKQSLRHRHLA